MIEIASMEPVIDSDCQLDTCRSGSGPSGRSGLFTTRAGDSEESGGLQHSSAEGLASTAPFSIFSGYSSIEQTYLPCSVIDSSIDGYYTDEEVDNVVSDTPLCFDMGASMLDLAERDRGQGCFDLPVGDVIVQDGGSRVDVAVKSDSVSYFFSEDPVFCTTFCDIDTVTVPSREVSQIMYYDCNESKVWSRPCGRACLSLHTLKGCNLQLNPCAFFDECFCGSEIDKNAPFIFQSVLEGFKIVDDSFDGSYFCSNYDSILDCEVRAEMDLILEKELFRDKVKFSIDRPQCVHALGAIKKSDGSIRPITDCKRPLDYSINNFMDEVCFDFSYISLDNVSQVMVPGCYFSVLDIKSAYRSVHVYPPHRTYQGFMWDFGRGDGLEYLVDCCLCFGLRCAPYLYTQLTEFIMRCMSRRGWDNVFGYLDDFIVVASSELECKRGMSALIDLLHTLGFQVAWKKVVPPAQKVIYLGILLDSISMTLSLPQVKLDKLSLLLQDFKSKSMCKVKDLQILAGHLAHASTVVRGGRTFSRRVINFLNYVREINGLVHLPAWFFDDIDWWLSLLRVFNGSAAIISDDRSDELRLETDSSMSGFGVRLGSQWFLGVWHSPFPPINIPLHHLVSPPSEIDGGANINVLELWPIVAACQKWGVDWKGRKVRIYTDNTQVLYMINTGRSSSVRCMCWLREIFWLSFVYNFHLVATYVRSVDNVVPDYLSRFFDSKRKASIPSPLTIDLCCFRSGNVRDPVDEVSI